MVALFKRARSRRLVLDIGSSAIRLCELSQTKTGFQLAKYYQRELGIDPALDDEAKLERKRQVLESLLKEAKVRTKKTIMAVPGQSVFTRNRPLPPVPEYKVTQIVRYEIQQQIPFSLDQIALDYQVLDRTEAGGYDVMMAAIKVDVVEKQVEIISKAKRSIDIVDVSPLAAYNWLKHTGEFGDGGECIALVDLGASTTDIVIQKDNRFGFTRSLNIGGNDITSAIASAFNVSFEEAEKLKRERGFAPTGNPQRDGKAGEIIGQPLGRLVGEITRSLAYFRSQPGGGPTTRVIVTGGGACLRNIIPYLQRTLGIEVRIAQPLAGLAIAPSAAEASEHPEQACVVLGLALRGLQEVPISINLIPPRILESARRKEQAFYWALSITTLLLIMASIIPVTAAKDQQVQKRIGMLKQVLAKYDPALVENPGVPSAFQDEFGVVKENVNVQIAALEGLDKLRTNRTFWLDYLKAINDARPQSGGVAIASVETAVIGGPGNTGDALRGGAAAKPVAEGANQPFAANSQPAAKKSSSIFADAFGAAPEATEEGGSRAPVSYNAYGFPGIAPLGTASAGSLGLAKGAKAAKPSRPSVTPPLEPNGFILFGYADTVEILLQFINNLKDQKDAAGAPVFGPERVYFDAGLADSVPASSLDTADIGGRSVGQMPNSGSGGPSRVPKKKSSGSGLGALGEMAAEGVLGGGAVSVGIDDGTVARVVKFRIDVQFLGQPQPQPGRNV